MSQRTRAGEGFQCPYHGWTYANTGKLLGVPWPEGYACDLKSGSYNLAQVPRVESYRGFIFGTLSPEAKGLREHLGGITGPIDEWLDRHPGSKVVFREAHRLKFKGNWKLAYDNSCDGYHVVFSHRSLLEMENRLVEHQKGDVVLPLEPRLQADVPALLRQWAPLQGQAAERAEASRALWEMEVARPAWRRSRRAARPVRGNGPRALDLASSEPVNINVFPNLSILGNHVQVSTRSR